jgi:hypothetical protein
VVRYGALQDLNLRFTFFTLRDSKNAVLPADKYQIILLSHKFHLLHGMYRRLTFFQAVADRVRENAT